MTQKEKAQRYDEALERARNLHKDAIDMGESIRAKQCEIIFPELAMSEEDKIRKDLIEWFDDFPDPIWRGHYKKDVIAWLEKQGEQESIDPDTVIQQRVDALADIVAGQNSTDELEPKFHEGDWITNGDYTWKIVKVKPLDYILQSQDGNIVDDTISHVNEHFHSFTIEDAKDGDVLFMDNGLANCIFIYKSSMNGIISKYASYNNFGFEGDHYLVLNDGYVIPATKEQRDTLFAKMKESGHRFDFEKKELKKVEQEQDSINPSEYINDMGGNGCYLKNTAQVSAWSEEDEKMVNDIIAAIDTLYYHGMVNWLKSLKRRCTWKPSEEQIIALNNAVLLNEDHYNGAVLSTLLEQLKKL